MKVSGFDDTIEWYDNNSAQYAASLSTAVPLREIEKFLKYLPEHPILLEAGCGPGRESKVFAERGARVTGVDVSEGLLKIARERNSNVVYRNADFRSLPFPEGFFDGVWAHASLVHLESIDDVKRSLREFSRVLKRGGHLYVSVKAQIGADKTAVVTDSLSKHDRFFRYYTQEELKGLLTEAGFDIRTEELQEDMHGRDEVKWIEMIAQRP